MFVDKVPEPPWNDDIEPPWNDDILPPPPELMMTDHASDPPPAYPGVATGDDGFEKSLESPPKVLSPPPPFPPGLLADPKPPVSSSSPLLPKLPAGGRRVRIFAGIAMAAGAVMCFGAFMAHLQGGSTNFLQASAFPENVIVPGCGLGNRLMTVANFLESGNEVGASAGVMWAKSNTMAAGWEELFQSPLKQVFPEELADKNYRWTSTEYSDNPLAKHTSPSGRESKSSTGHYAEVAGLNEDEFLPQLISVKPKHGGWAGITPARDLIRSQGGEVSISVGCLARKFGLSPSNSPDSFLRTLKPVDDIDAVVTDMQTKISQRRTSQGCAEVVGLHLRRGDIERETDKRHNEVFSDEKLAAVLATWPSTTCFFVATVRAAGARLRGLAFPAANRFLCRFCMGTEDV